MIFCCATSGNVRTALQRSRCRTGRHPTPFSSWPPIWAAWASFIRLRRKSCATAHSSTSTCCMRLPNMASKTTSSPPPSASIATWSGAMRKSTRMAPIPHCPTMSTAGKSSMPSAWPSPMRRNTACGCGLPGSRTATVPRGFGKADAKRRRPRSRARFLKRATRVRSISGGMVWPSAISSMWTIWLTAFCI